MMKIQKKILKMIISINKNHIIKKNLKLLLKEFYTKKVIKNNKV